MLLLGTLIWGFALIMSMKVSLRKMQKPKIQFVTDLPTFESILSSDSGPKLSRIKVCGNFTPITDAHPVVEAVLSRWKANSKPGRRTKGDIKKIALAIEGGGMRGCVSAGATAALNILGVHDTIDVVYGSSAGAMIGAYFISRQFSGVQIYHDILPSAGKRFIDKGKLLFAAGLPSWLNIFLRRKRGSIDEIMSFIPDPDSVGIEQSKEKIDKSLTDVINLDFLLVQVMGILQPLDWNIFTKNEITQPLKIVASSLKTLKPIVMSREKSNYGDLPSLLECIRASMAVPGITGGLMALGRNEIFLESSSKSSQESSFESSSESSYSVPCFVHKRSKSNQPYQTTMITSTASRTSSSKSGKNMIGAKINKNVDVVSYNGRGILKIRIMQELVGIGRVAIINLLKFINMLRSNRRKNVSTATAAAATTAAGSIESDDIIIYDKIDGNVYSKNNLEKSESLRINTDYIDASHEQLMDSLSEEDREKNMNINDNDDNRITVNNCEPVVDAFLCEPLPYRSAVDDGASHVIVLRTRPDPCLVLGKGPGVFEKLIGKRFFKSYQEQGASEWLLDLNHHRIYAEDVLRLSLASAGPPEGVNVNGRYVHLLSVAPSMGRTEVGQLEMRRDKVLMGMQDGARRVFEIFGPSILGVSTVEEIEELVQSVFPNEMLSREVSLEDFERTLVVQEGLDNQL